MKFDFKNVGVSSDDKSKTQTAPIGIKTPWSEGDKTGYFDMHFDLVDQLRDNFKNLILTNRGERIMQPDFGGNLRSIVFENAGSDSLAKKIAENVYDTTKKFMPFIELESLDIDDTTYAENNHVVLKIFFIIPDLTSEQQEVALSIRAS